ncbi:MAG: hypothetical protein NXI00_24010 [Cytophagales bacterium]|nr:hypothetical protein [Cytophagales bacterium]
MENTTEVEYVSIYDRPKRGRGRPKTCKLSDEEKRERLRANYKAYFNANPEKERERVRLAMARKRAEAKKRNLENQLFFGFQKNEFPFKDLTSL